MVFQAYSLFPHLTVLDNVAFGLKLRGKTTRERRQQAADMLDLVGLSEHKQKYAGQLSGGQQQRVALARALAIQPRVLLLDEPLSALDAKIRDELRNEIRRIQRELHITTIYVTHDQEEALSLSDRIVVMNSGRVEQIGPPFEIYNKPQTAFVAAFVGSLNTLRGMVAGDRDAVLVNGHTVHLSQRLSDKNTGESVSISLRPETVVINDPVDGHNHMPARVDNITFLGAIVRVQLSVNGAPLMSDLLNNPALVLPRVGDTVTIGFSPEACRVVA
jgi:putative spermidine/putrescine transport system ATP-binding protein